MDKPQSLSMREWLVRKIAPKLLISEKIVDAVIAHQFSEANSALLSNNTVEISGFGKFIFNTKKAVKKMASLENKRKVLLELLDTPLSETKRLSTISKVNNITAAIENLKPKLYGQQSFVTDLRGVEEQADSPSSNEGCNRIDEQRENKDLFGL
jgi:nucleoid DNA-binding protein